MYMEMCRFNIGEKVICIREKDEFFMLYTTTKYHFYEVCIIPTKLYNNIGIRNDLGNYIIPTWDDYVTLKEYRKLKLNKINGSQG